MFNKNISYSEIQGANCISFELCYDLGGMSYFSGQKTERGIWLIMRSKERVQCTSQSGGTYYTERYPVFGGGKDRKRLMLKLNRSNPTKLQAMWDRIKGFSDDDYLQYYLMGDGPLALELLSIEMGHTPELITVPITSR